MGFGLITKLNLLRRGFSILELAISVSIIGLIVIFIIGMYSMFFTANTKLNDVSIATFIGQSWLNKICSYANDERNYTWITERLNPNAVESNQRVYYGLYSANIVGGKTFIVRVFTNRVSENNNAMLYSVNVVVYWMSERVGNSRKGGLIRGYGKNYLDFSKVVSISKNL